MFPMNDVKVRCVQRTVNTSWMGVNQEILDPIFHIYNEEAGGAGNGNAWDEGNPS